MLQSELISSEHRPSSKLHRKQDFSLILLALASFALAGEEGMFQFERRKKREAWLQFTGIRSRGHEHVHPLTLKKPKLESLNTTHGQVMDLSFRRSHKILFILV